MKKKIITAMIFSAVLLTACSKENPPTETERETSAVSQSITAADEAETDSETAPAEETTVSEESDTFWDNFDKSKVSSDHFDCRIFSLEQFEKGYGRDWHVHGGFVSKSVVCEGYSDWGSDDITRNYLRFINVDSETIEAEIELPEGFYLSNMSHAESDDENTLAKAYIAREEGEGYVYGIVTVYKDYTYDIVMDDELYPWYYNYYLGIVDNGRLFDAVNNVEYFPDTDRSALYKFSIYENRFVYEISAGGERNNFGYYDIAAGKSAEFPDTADFFPVGYYDGKIYASLTTADSEGIGEIYSFDINTLEKKKFVAVHTDTDNDGEFINCFMSPTEAGYIAAEFTVSSADILTPQNHILYLFSLDSGEILAKLESNHGYGGTKSMEYIDGRIALVNFDNNEITLFDKKM